VVQWTDWFAAHAPARRPERFALRFDRAMMALDAVVQGLGVALESTAIAGGHLEAGRLRPVFDAQWAVNVQAHFVVYPERHGYRSEVIQFLDWLATEALTEQSAPRSQH
jgi:DNA-binding transcriptional LysR family regulator